MSLNLAQSPSQAETDSAFFYGLAVLLIFAPLFRGGNRPLPLLVMELAALALLAGWVWRPIDKRLLSWPKRIFLMALFLCPLAQLLPVPMTLWASLPGRSFYADALHQIGTNGAGFEWRAISLIPTATESAWLALLPPSVVFIVAIRLSEKRLLRVILVFLGIATAQALLGLLQFGGGPDSLFRLGNPYYANSGTGTYINRNHLAGLLEIALPVSLALLVATIGHSRPPHARRGQHQRRRTLRQWLARFSVERLNQAAIFGAVTITILLGLIFTRSRAGISLAMLGILLSTLLFSNRLGGRGNYGLIGALTASGIGLASLIGLAPVLSRFTDQDPLADKRWSMAKATLRAISEFFPLGSGAGTYEDVFRRFHPADFPGVTIDYAHNDYLEWVMECGLIAALLMVVWLAFYLRQWGRVWKPGNWTPLRFAQTGAGIALLLMMLHTLVDFNLQIPANGVFTALLAAVFFYHSAEDRSSSHRPRQDSSDSGSENKLIPPPVYAIPPENQANPFSS